MKNKVFTWMTYLYIVMPCLIFLGMWSRISAAVVFVPVIVLSVILSSLDVESYEKFPSGRSVWAAVVFIVLIVLFSGIGGYFYQNEDHMWRNEIFEILINSKWPVKYDINAGNVTHTQGLIYYIGFWLPAALVGKLFGTGAGYFAMFVWACLGLFLVWINFSDLIKKWSFWVLPAFIFFSGIDAAGMLFQGDIGKVFSLQHMEWWAKNFQFSSFATQLFWVYNQAVCSWLLILVILRSKNNKHIALVISCGLLECTFPFVGMIPYFIYRIIVNCRSVYDESGGKIKYVIKDLFTFENVAGGGCIGIVSLLYLMGNESGQMLSLYRFDGLGKLALAFVFIMMEAGVYYIVIYEACRKDRLYWISLVTLCVCPLVRVGTADDFCMRVSIPSLVVLFILVINSYYEYNGRRNMLYKRILTGCLIAGLITPFHEVARSVYETGYMIVSDGRIKNGKVSALDVYSSGNFSGDADKNIFYRYIAK